MDHFYHSINVLIVTAQKEAFGLVQLEAQASGVPVIVFDTQASREVQGDHSLIIVPCGDVATMAEYIRKITSDESFAVQMIGHGLSNAKEYSLKTYIERLEMFYQSLEK
jgi:glycosyltransferase involved in cell wall biosynthesis